MKIFIAKFENGYFISDYKNCIEHAQNDLDWGTDHYINVYCLDLSTGLMNLEAQVHAGAVNKINPPTNDDLWL